jgi:hypothetical protein
MSLSREEKKRRAIEKGKLLWKLVTTTAGVGDLAEPLRRVERNFTHLSKGQQITVVMIAHLFEEGINDINETPKQEDKAVEVKPEPSSQAITPNEVLRPGEIPKE